MSESPHNDTLTLLNENTGGVNDLSLKDFGPNIKLGSLSSFCYSDSELESINADSDCESNSGSKGLAQVVPSLTDTLGTSVYDVKSYGSIANVVADVIDSEMETNSFLVCNLASVVKQFVQWRNELPMVQPFYAVKCNPDPVIVKLLAALGCSFDCATMGEIDMVVNKLGSLSFATTGKASEEIVYANPAKFEHMLEFAKNSKVQMTVFDGEDELYKIAKVANNTESGAPYPFKLLLRITTEDKDSVCRFSKKFGCPYKEALALLKVAKSLNLNVAGVSFHVGSGCRDAAAYSTALAHARQIFEWGVELGMEEMHIIDLGGGFPGDVGGYGGPGVPTFQDIAAVIRTSINTFCNDLHRSVDSIRFIAEPGRYFVSACTVIATKVYSRKGGRANYQALYVDNGVYGSFNTVVYDHANPVPKKLAHMVTTHSHRKRSNSVCSISSTSSESSSEMDYSEMPTAVFGPTCDGLDQMCTLESTTLPRCEVGDWLLWENQGAYTHTASFVFNGYTHFPNKIHCFLA